MLLYILLICLIFYFYKSNIDSFEDTNNKICCLFAYYEKNDMYKENLNFFLNNGIYDEIDYYIIINDKCTLTLPNKPNIKFYIKKIRDMILEHIVMLLN